MTAINYHLAPIAGRKYPSFRVSVDRQPVGTVRYFYIRHLERTGWEATGPDGHLAVHAHRWQALWALTWNRQGYPFPVTASHEREVIIVEDSA